VSAQPVVAVVGTGTANLASVLAGLERAGARPHLTQDPGEAARAERVVLPGVGAFGAAMETLQRHGLALPLQERLAAGLPTLGICLGLQLLAETSEETPGVNGLGLLPCAVRRLPDTVRVPQLGWNRITPGSGCRLLAAGHVYFANSFALPAAPAGWAAALAEHGGPFVAALERGAVLACQFHPELSGRFGLELMRRWLAAAAC
jgi:imidazole glycerol phosphate synthase glutamine amidotransferase subunit